MREFKFRAWDKENETMYSSTVLHTFICFNGRLMQAVSNGVVVGTSDIQQLELMQYTGLRDNGDGLGIGEREIFEGDMILATNRNGWTRRDFEIIWDKDRARYVAWCQDHPNISFDLTNDNIANYKVRVIGNIYENKGR